MKNIVKINEVVNFGSNMNEDMTAGGISRDIFIFVKLDTNDGEPIFIIATDTKEANRLLNLFELGREPKAGFFRKGRSGRQNGSGSSISQYEFYDEELKYVKDKVNKIKDFFDKYYPIKKDVIRFKESNLNDWELVKVKSEGYFTENIEFRKKAISFTF